MRQDRPLPSLSILALVFVTSLPVLLYAALGQFSRLIADDYCAVAVGKSLDAWAGMRYWYENWAGSYANFWLKSALSPLDTLLPRITPALILLLWIASAFWLLYLALARLSFRHNRRALAFAFAAGMATAGIHAQATPQTLYWFAASTHYTLPLALLTAYLALCLWTAADRTRRQRRIAALAALLICFVSAGMSEIVVAFQFCVITLLTLLLWRLPGARTARLILAAGWLATSAGFLLQAISPGIAIRSAVDAEIMGLALRDPATLVSSTLSQAFKHFGLAPTFAGFMLLFALGFLLANRAPQTKTASAESPRLPLRAVTLGVVFQLLWLPLLWTHLSDIPRFFGRFSAGYFSVIALNLALIAGLLCLIVLRSRIQRRLRADASIMPKAVKALLLIVALLFAMTQLRSIHFRAVAYLFSSAIALLLIGAAQLRDDAASRQLLRLSYIALAIGLMSLLAVVFTALYGRGFVDARVLTPAAYALVIPGALLGGVYGLALGRFAEPGDSFATRICLSLALLILAGICLGQARLLPRFSDYARDWDARHDAILEQRDAGESTIQVAPLPFDLARYSQLTTLAQDPSNRCARQYYGVESILVSGEQ